MLMYSSVLSLLLCLLFTERRVDNRQPLSDCTDSEAVIHSTKTYTCSYYDNNTDIMGINKMQYDML
jgi:hypothetical protein